MAPHYLDHAATTPMLATARAAYVEELARVGNPSALHKSGRLARSVVEDARERMASALGAHPTEVIWTSGGTEADNLALKGLFWARHQADPRRTRIVTTAIEHHAGLDPVHWLEAEHGAVTVVLPVDSEGRVDLDALRAEVAAHFDEIALISVMWANNEVGTVQPVREVVNIATEHDIPVHADAVQAVGHIPVDFRASGLATMAVSAHKFGGPVGVGALVARRDLTITPLTHGGGQERKVRSGTLNAAGFHAASVAATEAVATLESEADRLGGLQRQLIARVREAVPEARLSGPEPGPERLPGNVHFVFPGCAAEALMFVLDSHGVEASNGSACSAGVAQASHVLIAMGRSERDAASTMRFSLGHTTTQDDLDALLAVLPEAVNRARTVAGVFDARVFG
ncbi:cysteine desulfurase family protein [Demequina muriae]|uniref:Cysteine desulfurase family protein n=1 Tax=Demequina muriae TaxID=3051664 RepID=A0ABT8GIC5_9MICO|nr:cysteine desulfurase family protein [Demequina sp. EGI L300058]MDN4481149.1 cysteine desulfurase family protein [Demequina sp. EGI L300058]